MQNDFWEAVKGRRSFYAIGKEPVLSDGDIVSLVENAAKEAPSAFNSQGARIVVLLGKEHDKLWDLTTEVLRAIVPADKFAPTGQKMEAFRNGYGTVLFFEEQTTVQELQNKFSLYRDNFPVWSLESSGMLQYLVWVALEAAGFGASLQHYNPLIDEKVAKTWNLPRSWKLLGEMPFGKPLAKPDDKTSLPVSDRVKVFR